MPDLTHAVETCPCGLPLHYTSPEARQMVERLVAELGAVVRVTTPHGSYLVPRHYIALHGLSARELPDLAQRLGFERVRS